MKTLSFVHVLIFFVLCLNFVVAQNTQIDGLNFENWNENHYNSMFPSKFYWENMPTSIWANSNAATTVVDNFCCERTSDCFGGSYAAKLETKSIFGVAAAGNLFTGKFVANGFNSQALRGVPFTDKPVAIKGYYKYTSKVYNNGSSNVSDSCAIYAILSYWNGTQRVEIARAEMFSSANVSAYTLFNLDFNYVLPNTPDTISIVFASSKNGDLFKGGIGSTLFVDEVELVYPSSLEENNILESVQVDDNSWLFKFIGDTEKRISIFDASGKLVNYYTTSDKIFYINNNNLPGGIYLYKIEEEAKTYSGKLLK
jgi:hypothetical protein